MDGIRPGSLVTACGCICDLRVCQPSTQVRDQFMPSRRLRVETVLWSPMDQWVWRYVPIVSFLPDISLPSEWHIWPRDAMQVRATSQESLTGQPRLDMTLSCPTAWLVYRRGAQHHQWYCQKFDNYSSSGRRAVVPFLWWRGLIKWTCIHSLMVHERIKIIVYHERIKIIVSYV